MLRLHPCELVNFFGVRAGSSCLNESKLPGQAGRQADGGGQARYFAQELGKLRLAFAWVSPSGGIRVVGRANGGGLAGAIMFRWENW